MPLAHKTYSFTYDSAVMAFYGPGLKAIDVRKPSRDFIHSAKIVYEISFLPGPSWIWYRLLPEARLFLKGREELRQKIEDFMRNPAAVAQASSNVKGFCEIFEKGKDQCTMKTASSWLAMWLTGLVNNSSLVMGWFFQFLLQSPALYKLVKAGELALGNRPKAFGSLGLQSARRFLPVL